ncbi:MAG: cellulase family glycosylhydrolase [Ignavibacteriales bacterium]|nr:cellulase family glycosylhydrolase [Ignavibacteriales bacterium]
MDRRRFIRTTGGLAVAGAFETLPWLTTQAFPDPPANVRVAIFSDESFPVAQSPGVERTVIAEGLNGFETTFLNVRELAGRLSPDSFDLFIMPYGSAFPKEAWPVIRRYLLSGGCWVNLGGVPFSVPVVRQGSVWRKETRQTVYHKSLGITQAFPVFPSIVTRYQAATPSESLRAVAQSFSAGELYALYVRFTSSKDFPLEDGSSGPRDAVIKPLLNGVAGDGSSVVAPLVCIDRLLGEGAGGRWVLANHNGRITKEMIRAAVEIALEGVAELLVRPSFACYKEGEVPSFAVSVRRPGGRIEELLGEECVLEVTDERGGTVERLSLDLHGKGTLALGGMTMTAGGKNALRPGLYHVRARVTIASMPGERRKTLHATTGFWIYDRKRMEGGIPLTVDETYFRRGGKTYPVTGTSFMTSDVHRKFLIEPNPHRWDEEFSAMKKAGINMVRTGIWTGWKTMMLDAGAPNEATLRALDAFILTARKHDIPVIFTLFAFLPEAWGGENVYLDPRSVNAQKEFVSVIARRYAGVNDLMWDYINEPSFCSPASLWQTRPNYDRFERAAWDKWLQEQFPGISEEDRNANLRERYRSMEGESLSPPRLEEFNDAHAFREFRPIKAIDFRLFAQAMFANWVKEMTAAVKSNGNTRQLITVGQDEGGTYERPSPQFFGDAVDFHSIHNWWFNDDLVWDSVMSRVEGKPLLVEETGIMFYEKMDGSAWRTEEEARNLLERKLAISLGVGGAGFIEWIWNTNPYMDSDNEAAIGLHRADGSAKPELESVKTFARWFSANAGRMQGRRTEDVLMVIPHSQMFSTRNFATEATRRCVRAMYYHLRTPMRACSEYRIKNLRTRSRLLIVPSPRTLHDEAWSALVRLAEEGAVVVISGIINTDPYWLPRERTKEFGFEVSSKPVAQEEFLSIEGREFRLSFRGEKIQRMEKAVVAGDPVQTVHVIPVGKGKLLWSPLPVEVSESVEASVELYKLALREAGIAPVFRLEHDDPSVLIIPTVYDETILYAMVSERDGDARVQLTDGETQTGITVTVPAQRPVLFFVDRRDGTIVSSLNMTKAKP